MVFRVYCQVVLSSVLLLLSSSALFANEATLVKEIADLDKAISVRRATLNQESAAIFSKLEAAERDVKANERRLQRHERKMDRAQERYDSVVESIAELDKWYQGLGAINQGLNSSTYETKKNALNVDKNTARSELNQVRAEKQEIEQALASSRTAVNEIKKQTSKAEKALSTDKKLSGLIAQKQNKEKELAQLRIEKSKPTEPTFNAYVYAISGKKSGELEQKLQLKTWVESYNSKYIEANWNGLTTRSSSNGSMMNLLSQMDKEFDKIPTNSKIILIGYGLGGGAAILVATEIAKNKNRDIALLVTLDPMGVGESRMNAVYETEVYCQGKISPEQYINCLSKAKKRVISSNVKNFYNRWQRESKVPFDAKDRMVFNNKEYVLSTGKFLVESKQTKSNQKRMYYGDKDAHQLLLQDAAQELPKLLVTHLR